MTEPGELNSEQPSNNGWDYDAWKDAGFQAIKREHAAESAKKRDILIALLGSLVDPELKLALLSLTALTPRLNSDDEHLVAKDDEVATAWFTQKEQEQQASREEFEEQEELVPQLRGAILSRLLTHPNLLHEKMYGDFDSRDVIVGEFQGNYKGEEINYRLVTPLTHNNGEEPEVAWIELPQAPELFDPAYTDFGLNVNQDRTRFSAWRARVNSAVAVVGSVVELSGDYCSGRLVLNNPSAPNLNYFGSIPMLSSYHRVRHELPVIFDQLLGSYGKSKVGRDTVIDLDSDQLKELLELVTTSHLVVE